MLPDRDKQLLAAYAEKIRHADIYGIAQETTLQPAPTLCASTGHTVLLKREDQQPIFSFKLRGAANKIHNLTEAEKKVGVITASAGNHAMGVALASKKLGIKAIIVMPRTTPEIKVNAVRTHGAEVVLHGDAFPDALKHALHLQAEQGLTFVHPYDDADVIAGQGTIGKEILDQYPGAIEAIFIPVGGGGLSAGITAWIKHMRPEIKIIGVEPTDSDCLHQALRAQKRVVLPRVGLFADGVAVAQIGEEPFRILCPWIDATIQVTADEVSAAAWEVFNETRTIPEPAGALGVAGLKRYVAAGSCTTKGALIAIVSGANVDSDRVRYMAERISLGQKREMLMAVTLPERAGALREFCEILGGISITEFNYRYASASEAHIFVGLRVGHYEKDRQAILERLTAKGFIAVDHTENELAKEHIRHMVGGRPPYSLDEVLYSFEFLERPGALLAFLNGMPRLWNISLFHYRSHGASHGRVLIGLQVPPAERDQLKAFIDASEFNGKDESTNPAYALFLDYTSDPAGAALARA